MIENYYQFSVFQLVFCALNPPESPFESDKSNPNKVNFSKGDEPEQLANLQY